MASALDGTPGRGVDKWIWAAALLFAALLLIAVVFGGWERLFEQFGQVAAMLVATLITLLGAAFAYLVGTAWYTENRNARAVNRKPRLSWLALYPFLLLISAAGVINVAFYYLEGPFVMKQSLDEAESAVTGLSSIADSELRNVAFEEKIQQVRSRVSVLATEINHPAGKGHCGVGPYARKVIGEIRALLPAFTEISGARASTDCLKAATIARSYRDQAETLLAQDPDYVRSGGAERQRLRDKLTDGAAGIVDRFKQARFAIDSASIVRRPAAYGTAQSALEDAAVWYSDNRQALDQLTRKRHDALPATIDLEPVRELGSLTTILPSLLRRILFLRTWIYVLIAIAADILILYLIRKVQEEFGLARRRSRRGPDNWGLIVDGTEPRFLWVNPK